MIKLPEFKPAWWLRNPHMQTMWNETMRGKNPLFLEHERLELPCGDFVDLASCKKGQDKNVLILPGLGGTADSAYIQGMARALLEHNFNIIIMHFRGYGKTPNRLPQMFHGGQTSDLFEVIRYLKSIFPGDPLFAVGFSIGGNILLKYLGEQAEHSGLAAAVAISVPFFLNKTQEHLSKGFAQIYQHYLLLKLKAAMVRKLLHLKHDNLDLWSICLARDMLQFDELVTVPQHGFKNAQDYYARSSSHGYLKSISTKTLIIHAEDDPFLPAQAIPAPKEVSQTTDLLITKHGGHVGFISGPTPRTPVYWLDQAVPAYLKEL